MEHEKIALPLPVSLPSPPEKNLKTKNYVVLFRIAWNLRVKISEDVLQNIRFVPFLPGEKKIKRTKTQKMLKTNPASTLQQ